MTAPCMLMDFGEEGLDHERRARIWAGHLRSNLPVSALSCFFAPGRSKTPARPRRSCGAVCRTRIHPASPLISRAPGNCQAAGAAIAVLSIAASTAPVIRIRAPAANSISTAPRAPKGERGSPSGVLFSVGLTNPPPITPAVTNARMGFRMRLSAIRLAMNSIRMSWLTLSKNFSRSIAADTLNPRWHSTGGIAGYAIAVPMGTLGAAARAACFWIFGAFVLVLIVGVTAAWLFTREDWANAR